MSKVEKITLTPEDLKTINGMATKDFGKDDIFVFRFVACDNQVDRNMERFDDSALDEMAELYKGVTMLKDHEPRADNQVARIYKTGIRSGENGLKQLICYAYVPVNEHTGVFISEIEAGIKKEISVSCSIRNSICSICGKDRCENHRKGKIYDGQRCCRTLKGITDVYEISFVAVPAQKGAGVIKAYSINKKKQDLIKELLETELNEFEKEFDENGF